MADYSMTLYDAMFDFPLEAALALWPALIVRNGGEAGIDHTDRASISARKRCKGFLAEHFRILPKGVDGPDNALIHWLASKGGCHG